MTGPPRSTGGRLSRRRFLLGGAALAAGGAAVGGAVVEGGTSSPGVRQPRLPDVALGVQRAGLPARQHAWDAVLRRDVHGNPVAPRFARLLFFDVRGMPTPAHAHILEAALRTLERRFEWGPRGLLIVAGWGPRYFASLPAASPVPAARGLSDFEEPTIDDYELCLHLASDDERRLAEVEAALLHGHRLAGADGPLSVAEALVWRETRTGFNRNGSAGRPSAHGRHSRRATGSQRRAAVHGL